MLLHWKLVQPGLHAQWETDEGRDGTPDFLITVSGNVYRMKSRTARQWLLFDTLADAKAYAESI